MNIFDWIAEQDPATMPFRPGVGYTEGFGLRAQDYIGSPFHAGTDRAGADLTIRMPFTGKYSWTELGGDSDFGSLLRIIPASEDHIEIQIAHTDCKGLSIGHADRGEVIPRITSGSRGMASGNHTHTEVLIPATDSNIDHVRRQDRPWITTDVIDTAYLRGFCSQYGLNAESVEDRLAQQIHAWGIVEAGKHYMIRRSWVFSGGYRTPHWGQGAVILLDSRKFLQI